MRGRVAAAQSVHECSAETRTSAPSCCSRHDARRKAAVTGGALVAEPLSRIMHAQQRPRGRSPESGPGSSSARELDVAVAGVGWSGGFAPATSPPRVVPREVVRPSTAAAAVLSRPKLGPDRRRPGQHCPSCRNTVGTRSHRPLPGRLGGAATDKPPPGSLAVRGVVNAVACAACRCQHREPSDAAPRAAANLDDAGRFWCIIRAPTPSGCHRVQKRLRALRPELPPAQRPWPLRVIRLRAHGTRARPSCLRVELRLHLASSLPLCAEATPPTSFRVELRFVLTLPLYAAPDAVPDATPGAAPNAVPDAPDAAPDAVLAAAPDAALAASDASSDADAPSDASEDGALMRFVEMEGEPEEKRAKRFASYCASLDYCL
ncbi:hypothetical protein E2562_029061 [Oryza meyeriana var. granulata]|uniref:Uncharacterized protein n=1 Tax=Oryza meyeriana var. granulata TaxID=110450 RepID=A0A6G1CTA0_9ORYZ|nr:hypothetical protein E2562_029061 [Oryza meyeriana var. granulata]